MMNTVSLSDIAEDLSNSGTGEVSRHVDELRPDWGVNGTTVRYWATDFFLGVRAELVALGETRRFVVVVPLSASDELRRTAPDADEPLAFPISVPTLYLTRHDDIFSPSEEEYRLPVIDLTTADVNCTFRSWRDLRSSQNGWEFSNDVYLS